METNCQPLNAELWTASPASDPFKLIDAFFNLEHLDRYKHTLSEIMFFMYTKQIYRPDNPGTVLITYAALRSFLNASCQLQHFKPVIHTPAQLMPGQNSLLALSSLSRDEFRQPFGVFKSAFRKQSLASYEAYLFEAVYLALSPHTGPSILDMTTPYIWLLKMLDAAQLIRERHGNSAGPLNPAGEQLKSRY